MKTTNKKVLNMKIIELMSIQNKDEYLNQLLNCKWEAGKWLSKIITSNKLEEMCKKNPRVLLLVNDSEIVSFCTYVHQDEINAPDMYPWIGFVYTYEQYRGNRYFGRLLNHIIELAKKENHHRIYLSTNETGLYEKYGFKYFH